MVSVRGRRDEIAVDKVIVKGRADEDERECNFYRSFVEKCARRKEKLASVFSARRTRMYVSKLGDKIIFSCT